MRSQNKQTDLYPSTPRVEMPSDSNRTNKSIVLFSDGVLRLIMSKGFMTLLSSTCEDLVR